MRAPIKTSLQGSSNDPNRTDTTSGDKANAVVDAAYKESPGMRQATQHLLYDSRYEKRCTGVVESVQTVLIYASCRLHELDDSHFSIVPAARDSVQDPGVSSVPIPISLGSSFEQRMHEILVVDVPQSLTTLVQATSLGQRDHLVRVLAYGLGPGFRGLDATVAKQLGGQAAEERIPLVRRTVELGHFVSMAHSQYFGSVGHKIHCGREGGCCMDTFRPRNGRALRVSVSHSYLTRSCFGCAKSHLVQASQLRF
mmetsp:Transcript_4257/g.27168  ORF Transcript_4257/g.27168 Transcript_4257/m.27168 type:complete len:254 (+) Transcript_4257:104-865(+)